MIWELFLKLKSYLADADEYQDLLNLAGYPQVRNACLLAAKLTDADAAVLIDDDEIFHLPDFLEKIDEGFSQDFASDNIECLVGYYVDAEGDYLIKKEPEYWDAQWPKDKLMNETFEMLIGGEDRYKYWFGWGH